MIANVHDCILLRGKWRKSRYYNLSFFIKKRSFWEEKKKKIERIIKEFIFFKKRSFWEEKTKKIERIKEEFIFFKKRSFWEEKAIFFLEKKNLRTKNILRKKRASPFLNNIVWNENKTLQTLREEIISPLHVRCMQ